MRTRENIIGGICNPKTNSSILLILSILCEPGPWV